MDPENFKNYLQSCETEIVIVIEIVSDEEQNIQEAHSPAVIESCIFSSDSEQEKTLSTYSRQKKVSRVLWMDEPVKDVPSIPYDIDGTTVFKVKAKNRLELLDALKDGRKWKKDSRTEWSGFVSVRYRDCSGGYAYPNTDCLFYKQFKYCNRTNFQNDGTCQYCSALGNYTPSLTRK